MVRFRKQSIIIQLLLYFQITAFSQSAIDDLGKAINLSRSNVPGDQVFLHLDRNLYHVGDTIRFQAYIRDRNSGVFGSESISLYSILLDQSNKIVDSARFRIVNSTASGWLRIPERISLGNYKVLAFTSMMMNYDPEFVFSVPIRIDELEPTNLEKHQVVEKKEHSSYQISSIQPTVDLRFLPEGGTIICNIPQRIAFNTVTSSGQILKVNGEVRNQRGEKVVEFISGEFGPGLIEFTPLQGDTYFATLKGKEFSGMKWPLPIPDSSGIAMRVNNNRKGMIEILLAGRGVEKKTWLLAFTMNNTLILSREVRVDSLFRLSLNTEELPAGTAYVTLYDRELNPVAERLIFVNNDKKMIIKISTITPVVKSGDETELILNTTDGEGENISSIISVAVIDSASGFCNALPFPDIESTFLYDRNFYNNLPAYIKIHGLNNVDEKSIDLLLMTYGWRKFILKENLRINPPNELLYYDYLKISNIRSGREGKLDIQILTLEDANILTFPVNKEKEAIIQYSLLNDSVRRIRILADNKSTKNLLATKIEFPENRSFTYKAKQIQNVASRDFNTSIPILIDSSSNRSSIPIKRELFSFSDNVINIEEVTIRPKIKPVHPPLYINKYDKLYQSASVKTLTSKDFAACPSIEDILEGFFPSLLDRFERKIYFRRAEPALFVLDDIPLGQSYNSIETIMPSQIKSITALKGSQGFIIYGDAAVGGVIFVTTKNGFEDDQPKKNDDLLRSVRLFRTEIEYYIPTKEEVDTIPILQHRPTILWMNDVFLDGKEPVKLFYPNNLARGTALVFVNGVSLTNKIGSNSYKYIIR